MKKEIQVAGIFLLSSLFMWNAYTILMEPEKSANKLFSQYADFRIWSNKAQRKALGSGRTMFEFPSSEKVKPYKTKVTHFVAYFYGLGSIGMLAAEQVMIIPLFICHVFMAFLRNNPFPLSPTGETAKYDNNMRAFLIDMVIACALAMVYFSKHPLAGEPVKSSKIKKN